MEKHKIEHLILKPGQFAEAATAVKSQEPEQGDQDENTVQQEEV